MTKLGEIQIAFRYKGSERQKTFITIKNSAGDVLVQTFVKRSVNDSYDKVLGRFYAFKKAMNQLVLRNMATREQRKEAWAAFKANVKSPKGLNLNYPKRQQVEVMFVPDNMKVIPAQA